MPETVDYKQWCKISLSFSSCLTVLSLCADKLTFYWCCVYRRLRKLHFESCLHTKPEERLQSLFIFTQHKDFPPCESEPVRSPPKRFQTACWHPQRRCHTNDCPLFTHSSTATTEVSSSKALEPSSLWWSRTDAHSSRRLLEMEIFHVWEWKRWTGAMTPRNQKFLKHDINKDPEWTTGQDWLNFSPGKKCLINFVFLSHNLNWVPQSFGIIF